MLTIRINKHLKRARNIISEVLSYDDIHSNKSSVFKMKKPKIVNDYISAYRIITAEKKPRIIEIFQSALNERGKSKYNLSITIDGAKGQRKDLEKLLSE
jgi:uncharacterized protein (UPF0216 family)